MCLNGGKYAIQEIQVSGEVSLVPFTAQCVNSVG